MKHWTVTGISLAVLVLMVVSTLWAKEPTARVLPSARSTVEANRRQLGQQWRSSPEDKGDSGQLQEAINRLRSAMHQPKVPTTTKWKKQPTRPTTGVFKTTTQPTTQPKDSSTTKPADGASDPNKIRDRIRKLNSIEDPAAVADALFQAKHPDLAVVFYDRAIKGKSAPREKAWLLFQAANCRRKTKPQAALKAYDALVAAHPDSLWSSIALVQKGIVEWQNTHNLETLFKDAGKQVQQSSSSPERK